MTLITVRPTRNDRRTIVWERDSRHPGGEAYIGARTDREFVVGETPDILRAIASGALERVAVPADTATTQSESYELTKAREEAAEAAVEESAGIYELDGKRHVFHSIDDVPANAVVVGFRSVEELHEAVKALEEVQPQEDKSNGDQPPAPGATTVGDQEAPTNPDQTADQAEPPTGAGAPANAEGATAENAKDAASQEEVNPVNAEQQQTTNSTNTTDPKQEQPTTTQPPRRSTRRPAEPR